MMRETCSKLRIKRFSVAAEQATHDEMMHGDKRKVYYHWQCQSWHTSREKVKKDVGLLER